MKCDKFDKCSRVGKCNAKNICCELSLQELEEWAKGKDFDSIVDKAFYIDGCKKDIHISIVFKVMHTRNIEIKSKN